MYYLGGSMKQVAPTLTFWLYPKPFKSMDFANRFRYGCNRFSQYGRSEQYENKSHLIDVNMFEILRDDTHILEIITYCLSSI